MTTAQNIKNFIEYYQDNNGQNPISSAFSTCQITQSAYLELFKSAAIAWIFIGITFLLGSIMDMPLDYFVPVESVAVILFFCMTFYGAVKFLSAVVIDAVADFLGNLLFKVDGMYEAYLRNGNEGMTRFEFLMETLHSVIFPKLPSVLNFLPMKRSLNKTISLFIHNTCNENEDDILVNEISSSSVGTMAARVHRAAEETKIQVGKPFGYFVTTYIVLWVGMGAWYFFQHYAVVLG